MPFCHQLITYEWLLWNWNVTFFNALKFNQTSKKGRRISTLMKNSLFYVFHNAKNGPRNWLMRAKEFRLGYLETNNRGVFFQYSDLALFSQNYALFLLKRGQFQFICTEGRQSQFVSAKVNFCNKTNITHESSAHAVLWLQCNVILENYWFTTTNNNE